MKLLLYGRNGNVATWVPRLRAVAPGVEVETATTEAEGIERIGDADAFFG